MSVFERIANRHIARCLTKIEKVHDLPPICAEAVRKEMHYLAQDVVDAVSNDMKRPVTNVTLHDEDYDNRGNR